MVMTLSVLQLLALVAPAAALRCLPTVARPAPIAPCAVSRCAVSLALDADPEDQSINDDEMLAQQQAHFHDAAGDMHDECVVTDMGTSCISIERVDGPDPYVPPQVDEARSRRSPGLVNNFYDLSTEDFKKPWGSVPSPAPSPRAEDEAFKAQADAATEPAEVPPPVGEARQERSPGLQNNFYDKSAADFRQPHGVAQDAAPPLPAGVGSSEEDLQAKVAQLEQSNERLEAALAEVTAREESLLRQLATAETPLIAPVRMPETPLIAPARVPRAAQWPVWSEQLSI